LLGEDGRGHGLEVLLTSAEEEANRKVLQTRPPAMLRTFKASLPKGSQSPLLQ